MQNKRRYLGSLVAHSLLSVPVRLAGLARPVDLAVLVVPPVLWGLARLYRPVDLVVRACLVYPLLRALLVRLADLAGHLDLSVLVDLAVLVHHVCLVCQVFLVHLLNLAHHVVQLVHRCQIHLVVLVVLAAR